MFFKDNTLVTIQRQEEIIEELYDRIEELEVELGYYKELLYGVKGAEISE